MSNELDNNRFKRLKALDEALFSSPAGVTMAELMEKVLASGVEANRFSIDRDLDLLDEMGFEIEKEKRVIKDIKNQQSRKVYFIKYRHPGNSLFKVDISNDEKDFLSEALAMLGLKGIDSMKFFRKLNLKAKTNKNKQIISFTKNPVENKVSRWFQSIYDSIRFKEVIRIGVRDRKPPYKVIYHTVHPWYLREYNRRWYLFGFDEEDGCIRRYTLDRITKLQETAGIKYRPAYVKMDDILQDVVGVSVEDTEILDILFWVSDVSADYVAKKYIHHSQKEVSPEEAKNIVGHTLDYEGGKYFTIQCKENYELRREMLSFGPALVVLTPEHLRDTLRLQLKDMLRMYE
ncbi:MAG: WYL domain-containing protein [Muribaculaceae bacterium]|nr:WYL domain-containing protein [Muribaculaceae bacterium]